MTFIDISAGDPFVTSAPAVPPRSRLFHLVPIGIGTSQQESLISLLVRIAYAHSVNPRELIGKILPVAEPAISELAYSAFFTQYAGTINGLNRYAELFVAAMEKLSGRSRLSQLTMLPWQSLFPHNGQGLLARHPRWCPVCLLQQRLHGLETIAPLIWSLESVKICITHDRHLENHCPNCGRHQPFIPRYPDLAVCDCCHRSLAANATSPRDSGYEPQGQFEYWVAEAVGNMLARQSEEGFSPSAAHFRAFMLEQVETSADGNRAAFCRGIGLRGDALNGWANKDERPSMSQFLKVCYGVKRVPADVFLTGTQGLNLRNTFRQPAKTLKNRSPCPRPTLDQRLELKTRLQTHLGSSECPPVSTIAAELGLAASCLRYWFPELCQQLTARYREKGRLRSTKLRARQTQRVAGIVAQLREAGDYPSIRKVNAMLRREGMSLIQPHLRDAYCAAMDGAKLREES